MKHYKPILNIFLIFFLSWAISYICSLALKATTFELSQEEYVHLIRGDYILFLSGDNQAILTESKDILDSLLMKQGERILNLEIDKARGRSFPVEVGIENFELSGMITIVEKGAYRLQSDCPEDCIYSLARDKTFTLAYGFVMTIAVVCSFVLLIAFMYNLFRIPIAYKVWKWMIPNLSVLDGHS